MLEDPRQLAHPLPPEVVEVGGRDQGAGKIVVAADVEDVLLQRPEAAIGQARAPQTASGAEEVQVEAVAPPATAGQDEARFQQREIKAGSVVRHETVGVAEQGGEGGEQRGLLVEIAHEVLAHLEPVAVEEADADEEGIGARAAGEAGGLGVKVEEAAAGSGGAGARQHAQRPRSDLAGAGESLLAVTMVQIEAAPHEQDPPVIRFLHGTAQRLFERRSASGGMAEQALGLEAPDDLTELGD